MNDYAAFMKIVNSWREKLTVQSMADSKAREADSGQTYGAGRSNTCFFKGIKAYFMQGGISMPQSSGNQGAKQKIDEERNRCSLVPAGEKASLSSIGSPNQEI